MICYMPFTDIEDRLLDKLTAALGNVTIYCPIPEMAPDHMLAAAREERLELRSGHSVPPGDLARAVQDFKAWADLHGGDITDLAGYFRSMQGKPPLIDETNPTAIGEQIRHFGEQNPQRNADPVFQAALFLSMAQEFDQQQGAVSRDLGDVLAMERGMLARLAGDAQELDEGLGTASGAGDTAGPSDAGGFMTARRVRSWAELVCRDTGPRSFILYVTSSPAVMEHLMDQFEQVQGPLRIHLGTEDPGNRKVIGALETLAFAGDPASVSADWIRDSHGDAHPADLTLYILTGISPQDFPHRLSAAGKKNAPRTNSDRRPVNTLVGLLEK